MITFSFLNLATEDDGFTPIPPNAPTAFNATDDENCQITFTWTDSTIGTPTPTYTVYAGSTVIFPIAERVTSPYTLSNQWGPEETYRVIAINSEGTAQSNTDLGAGVDTRPTAFTLNGTDDVVDKIVFTWVEEGGTTYDLYEHDNVTDDLILRASNVNTPYDYFIEPDTPLQYLMVATNGCGSTTSPLTGFLGSLELVTLGNVVTTGDYIRFTSVQYDAQTFDRADWHVIVDTNEVFGGSVYKLIGTGDTLRIGPLPYILPGSLVTVTNDVITNTYAAFTDMAIVNNSEVGIVVPPIYLLTENLVPAVDQWYLFNSASSGEIYNARLAYTGGDGTAERDDPWLPTANQYPSDGTINYEATGNGYGSHMAVTGWTAPQNSTWTVTEVYNVIMGVSYDIYSINYLGNETADIWLGGVSSGRETPLTLVYPAVPYIPPTEPWILYENPPSIINTDVIDIPMIISRGTG